MNLQTSSVETRKVSMSAPLSKVSKILDEDSRGGFSLYIPFEDHP